MTRGRFLLLLALTTALWLLQRLSAAYGLMSGSPLGRVLDVAANSAVAILVVAVLGWIVTELGLAILLRVRPSGVHRAIVYGLLTLAAVGWVFATFGVDVTAVITTSAVFAAAIGLALQPTLGGIIAGLVMHSDVMIRPGDLIELDGGLVRITGLGWRAVTADAGGGKRVVIPNATIVDRTVRLYPGTEPGRIDTEFPAPLAVAQERIERLLLELMTDVAEVDPTRPLLVMPLAFDVAAGHARYRVRYWVADIFNKTNIEADVLSRIWHGFQREQIRWPVSNWFDPALRDWTAGADGGGDDVLLFAPGERLLFPERCAGRSCVLKRGELLLSPPVEGLAAGLGVRERGRVPGREAALRQISKRLAREIGPYAELAVGEAARRSANLDEVIDRVAREIDDEAARAGFVADLPRDAGEPLQPGFAFGLARDSAGRLVSDPPMRALTHVTIALEPAAPGHRAGKAPLPERAVAATPQASS